MSSAIEVLKCMIQDRKCFCGCSLENSADTEINALSEAIVALEQKGKLEKWLNKKIVESERYPDTQEPAYYYRRVLELMK